MINDRYALITGSTGGIGASVAKALSSKGYRLLLVDIDRDRLEAQANQYLGAEFEVLDLSSQDDVLHWCRQLESSGRSIEVAFVNAGVIAVGDVVDLPTEKLLLQLNVNLVSTSIIVQSIARMMRAASKGHLLATVSMGGIVSLKGSATGPPRDGKMTRQEDHWTARSRHPGPTSRRHARRREPDKGIGLVSPNPADAHRLQGRVDAVASLMMVPTQGLVARL